jgi:RND family efflux transporter MFP subunit
MNRQNRRPLRVVLVLLLVAVIGTGGYWLYQTNAAAKPAATTATSYTQIVAVTQGNLSSSLSVVGELDALQRATMTFERMGSTAKLLTLQVKAGNTVTAGQILATIDPAPYQQALDQVKSDVQAAEEKLADLKTPATSAETAKAEVAVAQAQANLETAKADLAKIQSADLTVLRDAVANAEDNLAVAQLQQTLAEHDATAKTERDLFYAVGWHQRRISDLQTLVATGKANLEQTRLLVTEQDAAGKAQSDLAVAQARRESALRVAAAKAATAKAALADAQDALAAAQAGGNKLALAKAQLAVKNAEVALATAQDGRTTLTQGSDAVTLAAAQADADKKRLAQADAEAALAGTKLTAPFGGTILQTNVTPGNLIGASTKILTLADLKALQVLASVDETTIKKVSKGQTAQVTFDALPGQTLRGQVGEVPLQGALQGGVMVYEVPISLTGADRLTLLIGMTANVKVQLGQAQNALLVPAMAVQRSSSGYQVMVPNVDPQGAPAAVAVEIGLSDGVHTQILRGLNLGDKVVTQLASTQQNNNANQRGGLGIFGSMFGGR